MNLDSPSEIMKNIETFFGSSPDSPSFLPSAMLAHKNKGTNSKRLVSRPRPSALSTHSINTLFHHSNAAKDDLLAYNSPTTTLAADLSENFHIEENQENLNVPTPKRSLVFNTADSSTKKKPDSTPSLPANTMRPPLVPSQHRTSSTASSSRTTSNASIVSVGSSVGSVTSIDSTEFANTAPQQQHHHQSIFNKPRHKTLRRAKTSLAPGARFHSYSTSTIELTKSKWSASLNDDSDSDLMAKFMNSDDDDDNDNYNDKNEEDALDRLFAPSPIPERTTTHAFNAENPGLGGLNKREIGSPIQKKPIRSKVRRTHSMFYSKKEITDTTNMFGNLMGSPSSQEIVEEDSFLSNSVLEKSKIQTFSVKNDLIPRINVDTLCKILDGHYKEHFNEVMIVDCRFEYEYKGGHIDGAINVSSQQELEEKFLTNRPERLFQQKKNTLIVFHCEFSSYRGPLMASHLRTCDRNLNQDNYPHLDYPDILILEGGYKSFFDRQAHRCYPQKYVEMNDNNHKNLCEKELDRFRRDLKRASSYNSLSFTASLSQSSSQVYSHPQHSQSSRSLHKRTSTCGPIAFQRRSSLKTSTLDFTRSSVDLVKTNKKDDTTKPPESLNFGFKFPPPIDQLHHHHQQDQKDQLQKSPSDHLNNTVVQPNQMIKNKLSRSFTTGLL